MDFRFQSEANLDALLEQTFIVQPELWVREAMRTYLQYVQDVFKERNITLLDAWEQSEQFVDRIVAKFDGNVQDFEDLHSHLTENIEQASRMGPGGDVPALTYEDQDEVIESLIESLETEINSIRQGSNRYTSAEAIVRPENGVRSDSRRAQIIQLPEGGIGPTSR